MQEIAFAEPAGSTLARKNGRWERSQQTRDESKAKFNRSIPLTRAKPAGPRVVPLELV